MNSESNRLAYTENTFSVGYIHCVIGFAAVRFFELARVVAVAGGALVSSPLAFAQGAATSPAPECVLADSMARSIYQRVFDARKMGSESEALAYSRVFWDLDKLASQCPIVKATGDALGTAGFSVKAIASVPWKVQVSEKCPMIVVQGSKGLGNGKPSFEILKEQDFKSKLDGLKLPDKGVGK
jgi:hypothetical protein